MTAVRRPTGMMTAVSSKLTGTAVRRVTGIALAASTVAMGVTGCGNDQLFHRSTTAATYQGRSVSVDQVQDAVRQIKQAFGTDAAQFDNRSAIVYLVFADDLQRIASSSGAGYSDAQARADLSQRKVTQPTAAAVTALRSNIAVSSIGSNQQASQQLNTLITKASVQVNPRFGQWSPSKGVVAAAEPWISAKK